MPKPVRFTDVIVCMYKNNGHPIKKLKMDIQFNTSDVISYLAEHQISNINSLLFLSMNISVE